MIFEPVQGEGGFTAMPPEASSQGLKERCERHGILYIDDEVQSGMGRTGTRGAVEHSGVEPDLMTCGASRWAAGMPLAGVAGRAEVMDAVHPGGLGGTYGGNPVACAAAIESSTRCSTRPSWSSRARSATASRPGCATSPTRIPAIGEVRGLGPMLAIELVTDRESRQPAAGHRRRAPSSSPASAACC